MMEIHTLTYIDDRPGITATELSKLWHKSKSAISQTIKVVHFGFSSPRLWVVFIITYFKFLCKMAPKAFSL